MYKSRGISKEMPEKDGVNLCKRIATEIETNMWITYEEKLNSQYKDKFRTLFYNLQDTKNTELRLAILSGQIKPNDLLRLDSHDLAPSNLKQQREKQEEKYFKGHILESDPMAGKIVAKSHKGEIVVNEDYLEEISLKMLEEKKKIEEEKKLLIEEEEENKTVTEGNEELDPKAEEILSKIPIQSPQAKGVVEKLKKSKKVLTEKIIQEEPTVEKYLAKLSERYRTTLGGSLGERMAQDMLKIGKQKAGK